MKVDAYGSMVHYQEHIWPVWSALPSHMRGIFADKTHKLRREERGPVICASLLDAQKLAHRPVFYVEHGAGQTYPGDLRSATHGSYSGGKGLGNVVLFLCPSQAVADRWHSTYPNAVTAVVGCPKLDHLHADPPKKLGGPTVAMTFHWDCPFIPETMPALPHYRNSLSALKTSLAAEGVTLVGHSHPRGERKLHRMWTDLGIPYWQASSKVLHGADLLVADNTSLLYEMASVGKPVVALNAPWYRREIEHGLRFWSHVPGFQVDEPDEMFPVIMASLTHPGRSALLRSRAVHEAYAFTDGQAADRARAAIVEVMANGW